MALRNIRIHYQSIEKIKILIRDSLTNELLRRTLKFDNPRRLTFEAEYKFKALILIEGKIFLKPFIEWGIRTEYKECSIMGI